MTRAKCEILESRVMLAGIGLADSDIGSPAMAGSAAYTPATNSWVVSGGGADIWNTSDSFNYASEALSGNGSAIVKVQSQGNTSVWAKAGLMLRNDTSAGSVFADVVVTPANGIVFQYRSAANAAAVTSAASDGIVSAPIWLKLSRSGSAITASYSYDGSNWIEIGTGQSLAFNPVAQIGLAVCAVNSSALSAAAFQSLSVVTNGWSDSDIGSPGLPGYGNFDGNVWTVAGSGQALLPGPAGPDEPGAP